MRGTLVVGIEGYVLAEEDKIILSHPAVGGVILFTRNYQDKSQLRALTAAIKSLKRDVPLFIVVDQEGGKVQRFKTEFITLPSAHDIGLVYDKDKQAGLGLARAVGFCLAAELIDCGVDFSFTPVLDIDYGLSEVIGSRSFHHSPSAIIALSEQLIIGLKEAGMIAVGKHFPGHGGVVADSHVELPVEKRDFATIEKQDLHVFSALMQKNMLPALMTAHLVVENVDALPVTFSSIWLKTILREQLKFDGVVFSDDLSMKGAFYYPDVVTRAEKAMEAGCDYLLICNNREDVKAVLSSCHAWSFKPREYRLYAKSQLKGELTNTAAFKTYYRLYNEFSQEKINL